MAKLNEDTGNIDYWTDPFNPPPPDVVPDVDKGSPSIPLPTGPQTTDPGAGTSTATDPNTTPTVNQPSDKLLNYVNYFGQQNPGANPSVQSDPNYWATRIGQTPTNTNGVQTFDLPYWDTRMMTPEGPPEGAGGTPGGTSTSNNPGIGPGGTVIGMEPGGGFRAAGPGTQGPTSDLPGGNDTNGSLQSYLSSLLQRANGLLDRYSQPVTANDPTIQPLVQAYHGTTQRALADYRERAAERAHAEGTPTGAFDSQIGNAEMDAGNKEGTLEAQLMNSENQQRRQALAQMFGLESGDVGLGDQTALGQESLQLQDKLGSGSLSNQLLLGTGSLANQGTSINNQNTQFYDNLGWLMSQYGNNMDSVLARLLAGG